MRRKHNPLPEESAKPIFCYTDNANHLKTIDYRLMCGPLDWEDYIWCLDHEAVAAAHVGRPVRYPCHVVTAFVGGLWWHLTFDIEDLKMLRSLLVSEAEVREWEKREEFDVVTPPPTPRRFYQAPMQVIMTKHSAAEWNHRLRARRKREAPVTITGGDDAH